MHSKDRERERKMNNKNASITHAKWHKKWKCGNNICYNKNLYLNARILKAVRSNFPGDTGNFRQNIGNAISMSFGLSSLAFQLAPIFKLFNFRLSLAFAMVVGVDDDDDDVAAVVAPPPPPPPMPSPSLTEVVADDEFGTCFWYKINIANEIR